ncbi:MAG: acetyl-CoA carboxylase biotin carboxylase subunit, partial [Roseivirga sp.]
NNFLPDIGKLTTYQPPKGPGVRVDDGFEEGMDIPIYYDPMIAKLVTYGKDRTEAIQRMVRAIQEYNITGVKTTLNFCEFAIQHEAFTSGKFDTKFVQNYFKPEMLQQLNPEHMEIAAVLAAMVVEDKSTANMKIKDNQPSNWKLRVRD